MIRQEVLKRKHVGGVEILLLDAPGEKVNKLTEGLIQEFSDTLDQLEADETIQGVLIISGKERNFIAGADIAMFQKRDRKSTRLNSSHVAISYAVFCLKKKNKNANSQIWN